MQSDLRASESPGANGLSDDEDNSEGVESELSSTYAPTRPARSKDTRNRRTTDARNNASNKTSIRLFREFMVRRADGTLDASRIHSKECYEAWLRSRKVASNEPEKSFQRTLSSHLTAVDGRSPFTPEEEAVILAVLRRKERWPCFAHCAIRFGHTGFRALGYHEKRALESGVDSEGMAAIEAAKKRRANAEGAPTRKRVKQRRSMDSENTDESADTLGLIDPEAIMDGLVDEDTRNFSPRVRGSVEAAAAQVEPDVDGSRFMRMVHNLFSSLSNISMDAWRRMFAIARMMLVTSGWFRHPSIEEAKRFLDAFAAKYPHDCILIFDPLSADFRDRFIIQNDISRRYVGAITRSDGGYMGKIIRDDEAKRVVGLVTSAFRNRGKCEVPITTWLLCLGNVQIQFEGAIYIDPETVLVIFHGRPSQWRPALGISSN